MPQVLGGQGSLSLPQNMYPSELFGAPYDWNNNYLNLSSGDTLVVPAGTWLVDVGLYSVLQYPDPVTGVWRTFNSYRDQPAPITSNGQNLRIANLTGCPIAAQIQNGGTSFSAATATITANVGGSTWVPVVGGSLSVSSVTVKGAGFTVQPIVVVPAPPSPGIQATAYAVLTGSTVSSVTLSNVGAGYTRATIACPILPNPFDPNVGSVTPGTVTFILANAGLITGALCTNNGASLATLSALTLTAAGGAGSGATIVPVIQQTVVSASVVAGGAGWGVAASPALITSVNGVPATTSAIGNPALELTTYVPRPFQGSGTANAGGTISAVVIRDPGLFAGTPTAVIATGGTLPTTLASIAFTMGGGNDTVLLQPL